MNPRANKEKGYRWEVDCVDFLQDEYPDVKRNGNLNGPNDRGDLRGVPGWTLQCKDTQDDRWSSWWLAASAQSVNNSTRWWAVIRKVRRKGTAEAVFAMPLVKGKELMAYLRDLECENAQLKAQLRSYRDD